MPQEEIQQCISFFMFNF